MTRTYADRGGTFTDVVVQDDAGFTIRKVPSDTVALGDLAVGELVFATTVATNALLTNDIVPVLLVVTSGFADLERIGDMTRPSLFDPDHALPRTLAARTIEVDGRINAQGEEISPLQIPTSWPLEGIAAVAVVLCNSHRNAAHELAVAAQIRAAKPQLYIVVGHTVSPSVGFLARLETTLVDAAVTPILRAAIERDRIPRSALALRSDGSLTPIGSLTAPDAILSGPAGGVLAVAQVAHLAGLTRVIGLDMGGTSTDVCVLTGNGPPMATADTLVGGVRVRRPMLRLETIAAGGGSVASSDGRLLHVGPQSAGASPGPQCYGRGGPPTVTDAGLALGLVDGAAFDPPLNAGAIALPAPADEIVDLCREQMARAVQRLCAEFGEDPSDFVLVAFGGAAGQHAAATANKLGIRTVLVHPFASVLSAWGLSLARRTDTASAPVWCTLPEAWPRLVAAWDLLARGLPGSGPASRSATCRILGTDSPFEVQGNDADALTEAFHQAHVGTFGMRRDALVEVVDAIVRVSEPTVVASAQPTDPWGLSDDAVSGPSLIRSPTTSVHVPTGWVAQRRDGLLWLENPAGERPAPRGVCTPHGLAVWASRFMVAAEEAGAVLRRLAQSVNIRERLDFSCAIFDGEGHLVANAPHVPVHLGAMGETVRDLLRTVPDPEPGVAWLCNHPVAGGSHLPDLTVTTTVVSGGRRWFVACRGHHVDVGGLTPGSMPPHATSLAQEGIAIRHVRLDDEPALAHLLAQVRQPDVVRADLLAQVAANRVAATRLCALGPPHLIEAWMGHLRTAAADSVADYLRERGPLDVSATDVIDGVPLCLHVTSDAHRLKLDFTGSGGPHRGNLNAPRAVTRAAVLYALRVVVRRPIPLNEGALEPVVLVIPAGSILDPPEDAAVAGGNVETSQRIVDLLLRCLEGRAASQGTMNNLTLGGVGWSLYETVGGGGGASERGPGVSGRQVHLTNTKATDVEVIEARLPLRVVRFALRPGSEGDGFHRGGMGLVREIEVLAPTTAALLATRRAPPGAAGGSDGKLGSDAVRVAGRWREWDGQPVQLEPGDRVRVETPGGGGWGLAPR